MGSTAYEEDIKPAVPYLYNPHNSGTAASHRLTSLEGTFTVYKLDHSLMSRR